MASVWIITRTTTTGAKRYAVRYRIAGKGGKIHAAGTFATRKEALARRDFILLEFASGRDPRVTLLERFGPPPPQPEAPPTMRDWWERFERARSVDVTGSTHRTYAKRWAHIDPLLGEKPTGDVTVEDLQELVAKLIEKKLSPGYIGNIINLAQMILDEACVEPNPARSRRLRLPKVEEEIPIIAPGVTVDTLISLLSRRFSLFVRLLERTGMRISEAADLEWEDVDERNSRLRVKKGKTRSARRWVFVPPDLMAEIAALCPREDRVPGMLVFRPRQNPNSVGLTMSRTCQAAGLAKITPHDLRHRFASIMAKLGVPRTDLIRQLGHSKPSELDTYEHSIVTLTAEELEVWEPIAARLSGRQLEPARVEVEA